MVLGSQNTGTSLEIVTKTRRTLTLAVLALGISGSLQPADAQVSDPVSILVKISIDPSVGGTAIGAASGTIDGVPALIEEASWTDTHSEKSPLPTQLPTANCNASSAALVVAVTFCVYQVRLTIALHDCPESNSNCW